MRPIYDRQGRTIYYLGIQYDITNQVEAEKEMEHLNALIRKADER